MKCLISGIVGNQSSEVYVVLQAGFFETDTILDGTTIPVYVSGIDNTVEFQAAANAAVLAYAAGMSYTLTEADIIWSHGAKAYNPGTHITDGATDAATNAPTNLNVLTTLLGTLTGEVNATNTKQNDLATKYNALATKFNTLLDRLEAHGILLTS